MVSRVLYRPFEESDFDAIATILQADWHNESDNDGYNYLEACADLCYCLSVSTFSQVACIDGKVRGIALARAGRASDEWAARWDQAKCDIVRQMHDIEPEQTEEYLGYLRRQISANNRLLQESGISKDDEITLLAVSSQVQGLGIGTVLLDAATSYVSAQGASTAFLYTDTDCTWKFYESHHFKRMAHYRAKWKEHLKGMPKESFLYGLDLTA